MSTSIREQIIAAIASKLAIIRTTNGYATNLGANVDVALPMVDATDNPALVVWGLPEEATHEYGQHSIIMPVKLDAFSTYGSSNTSTVGNAMMADIIEAMMGPTASLPFNSGGTYTIAVGDTITGATSGATAYVQAVSKTSGEWAAGTAAGTLTIRRFVGQLTATENLNVGANLNVATCDGAKTLSDAITLVTNSLAKEIIYVGGGIVSPAEAGHLTVAVEATFNVKYYFRTGNPYSQRS